MVSDAKANTEIGAGGGLEIVFIRFASGTRPLTSAGKTTLLVLDCFIVVNGYVVKYLSG
jgi:hypothetical protein